MTILDRHILVRFLVNFAMLFALLFLFGIAIDLILNLDRFVDAARANVGQDVGGARVLLEFAAVALDFHGPRLFQFYGYLHGLVAIGAMGFTLAQMHRYRELVAIMASGVSLYRVAMPFTVAVFGLSMLQLLNQELLLPRVAPLLLRGHDQIGQRGFEQFEIRFTADGKGNLLQAISFNPQTRTLIAPTILERDERGRTMRRITADQAVWSDQHNAWELTNGIAIQQQAMEQGTGSVELRPLEITHYQTDLKPHTLLVRRYNQFAGMLSLAQIGELLQTPRVTDQNTLRRYQYSRFSSVLVNMLVLWLALPCFLLREPANLLRQSVLCASLSIPAMVGSAIGMIVALPGFPPAVSVFLPVIVLIFMTLAPWTYFKT